MDSPPTFVSSEGMTDVLVEVKGQKDLPAKAARLFLFLIEILLHIRKLSRNASRAIFVRTAHTKCCARSECEYAVRLQQSHSKKLD
jgi:hypothetical protein